MRQDFAASFESFREIEYMLEIMIIAFPGILILVGMTILLIIVGLVDG